MAHRARHQSFLKHQSQLEALDLARSIKRATAKIGDFERMFDLLSLHNVSNLRVVLAMARKRGCSTAAIVERLADAVEQRRKPRSFDDEDVALATLALRLGGPVLLHALGKARGFPSQSFLYKHGHLASFTPTVRVSVWCEAIVV